VNRGKEQKIEREVLADGEKDRREMELDRSERGEVRAKAEAVLVSGTISK